MKENRVPNSLYARRSSNGGFQGVNWGSNPDGHDVFQMVNIPIIDGLINVNQIKKQRVFYIGTVVKWFGLDACWLRAIALEEL